MAQQGDDALAGDVDAYLRQLAAAVAAAGRASEPKDMAAALAEAQRATAWGLRSAVRLAREHGLSWRELAEMLDVPASTLHRQYRSATAGLSVRDDDAPESPANAEPGVRDATVTGGVPPARDGFVGRGRELAHLIDLVWRRRLVTVVGTAGVGKSRLVSEYARRAGADYPGGVWWVELASITRESLVGPAVIAAGGQTVAGRDVRQVFAEATSTGPALLVLDNCEHLLDGVADVVTRLRDAAPDLRILATSRGPLQMPDEAVMPLAPLQLAAESGPGARSADAVRLFTDRAREVKPEFDLDAWVDVVVEICDRLDGLPLAIELAARQSDVLEPKLLLSRLTERLDLFTVRHTAPARQHSLREAIAWSYDLLDETMQAVFARLCILPGGFDQHTAAAVTGDLGLTRAQLWALLADLTRKSMMTPDPRSSGRFRILESLRAFGQEVLEDADNMKATQIRLAEWIADFQRRLADNPWGISLTVLSQRIAAETENTCYAVGAAKALGHRCHPDLALLLAAQLIHRMEPDESRGHLLDVLNNPLTSLPQRQTALEYLADNEARAGNHAAALTYLNESLDLARSANDADRLYTALLSGMVVHGLGSNQAAGISAGTEAVQLLRETGQNNKLGRVLNNQAWLLAANGDIEAAGEAILEALATYEAASDEKLAMEHRFASRWGLVLLGTAATVATMRKDDTAAAGYLAAILTAPFHDRNTVVLACECAAVLAGRRGDNARALTLLAGAVNTEHTTDDFWTDHLETAARKIRRAAGPAVAAAAAARGRTLTVEELTAYALGGELPADKETSDVLTAREHEVAQSVALGLTNARIAAALSISERTVVNHLVNIRAKLGLRSRMEVALWASRINRHKG